MSKLKTIMKFFGTSTWPDVIKHFLVISAIGISVLLFFFFVYMPIITNHGETITVPDVIGISVDDLDDFLVKRNLRYEISYDSGYSSELPPLSVLKQFPKPNAKVKENRKIYLTLNANSPPMVRMPNLVEGSIKNAQMTLKSYDLVLGKREYIPDLFFNTVLEQRMDGREIMEGEMIPKGSVIDVVLGDGMGQQSLESPNLIGLDEESAMIAIIGSGLNVGEITYVIDEIAVVLTTDEEGNEITEEVTVSPGGVQKQRPVPGNPMRLKQDVDIWIYKPDSLNFSPSLLDH